MTTIHLKGKFIVWSAVLLSGALLLGGISLWHLTTLRVAARAAAAEYDAMDRADATNVQIAWLRDSLRGASGPAYRDPQFFVPIQTDVLEIVHQLELAANAEDGDGVAELDLARNAATHLDAALAHSASTGGTHAGNKAAAVSSATELERVRESLASIVAKVPGSARRHVAGAADRLSVRIGWTWVVLGVVLVMSIGVHVRQYQMLVRPLMWLRDDMRESAAHEYHQPVRLRGDLEFQSVAGFFNGLAGELAELYRSLEQKVITRTRELVRSERLASVGYLAAGVAHEINNPLSVISGYAELAGKSLRNVLTGVDPGGSGTSDHQDEAEAEALASAFDAQVIIRDEAFRCKEITARLLSLARGGGDGRQTLRLDEVAQQVSVLTKGLKNYRDRKVIVDFSEAGAMEVIANPTEMKQVLLNLTVNALDAVVPERGEVRIGGRRAGDWVEVSVEDNGKGMAADMLEQVFEPFFTNKRGAGEPGTGLGLSITHAIVESHGGRISAESRGPGHGSRFTIRLPARGGKLPSKSTGGTPLLTGA